VSNPPYRISLNEWLDFFGFSASPFSKWEAEEEARLSPKRLSDQWVKPACFDRILGQASEPKTVLVFAPRGAGKTACRILVEYYCKEGLGQGERGGTGDRVLPVLHIHHDEAIRQSLEQQQTIDEYWHTREILKQAVQALTDLLQAEDELSHRVDGMSPGRLADLQWFFYTYPPASMEDLESIQKRLGFTSVPGLNHQEIGFLRNESPLRPLPSHVQDHFDARRYISPIEQLYLFVDLMCADKPQGFGFEAVYVLLDGLDEFSFSADLTNEHATRLLVPLLSNLRLMNAPNMAFKCFLPAEISTDILHHPTIRRDRLGFETITWSEHDMREILRRRLATYGPVQEIDMLCAPELRGLERKLIEVADGNPRRMIRLCDFLLQAHLERPLEQSPEELGEGAYLFSRSDWEESLQRIDDVLPIEQMDSVEQTSVLIERAPPRKKEKEAEQDLESYPAPIALLYLDYRRRQGAFERMGRMLDLFEATAAFVAVILLSQLTEIAGDETAKKLRSTGVRLRRTSLGASWLAAWERLPGLCNALGKSYYARRLQSIYSRYREHLEALRILRNETRGHGATGSEQDALDMVEQYGPQVEKIISALSFLNATQLIKVENIHMQDGQFSHKVRLYQGSNPNFPWETLNLTFALECDKILLMRDSNILSLYPFMVTEFCPDCRQEEIFTYQKLDRTEVHYLSYHTGHRLRLDKTWNNLQRMVII
jgi:hypothetical protein